ALNDNVEDDVVIDMLSQHIVIRPVISALFGDYPFAEKNPISSAMTSMLDSLDSAGCIMAADRLNDFYSDVKRRCCSIKTLDDRQKIVVELFNSFFKLAFPKQQEKFGIVYTPIPIVDFIDRSVSDILQKEFGESLADDNVHILDPFTGTGTFITRLMKLIPKDRLPYKYWHELHAHEIMPLAYYIAAINIESEFYALCPEESLKGYQPNRIAVWTDTFAGRKKSDADIFTTDLIDNQRRIDSENELPVRVIIGNPPYSVGQKSQNDDNQNDSYPELDERVKDTYIAGSANKGNKNSLYDSYIRAYRWASDRIGDRGVIGFVTNAGWIDSASSDGMRKCMEEEFSSIYIYHLRGNCRTSGEERHRQGGNVFGLGSRAPVAIVILVKNPDSEAHGKIYFHEVADYLTAEEKLDGLNKDISVLRTEMQVLEPNDRHSWLNQENEDFYRFFRMDGKKTDEQAIFENYSNGIKTNRDIWAYNSSRIQLKEKMSCQIDEYNRQLKLVQWDNPQPFSKDSTKIKWSGTLLTQFAARKISGPFSEESCSVSAYRPFVKQILYYNRMWNEGSYQMPSIFPTGKEENRLICLSSIGDQEFSVLMTDSIPDLHFVATSQCFPLYLYDRDSGRKAQDLFTEAGSAGKEGRHYAITDTALARFRKQYQTDGISKEGIFYYIYGILHSEDYRKAFANNLMKDLPRIPLVPDLEMFKAFTDAGRTLADLHVNYESAEPYDGVKIEGEDSRNYRVEQLKYGKIPGKTGNAGKDKSVIVYNGSIVIRNIPLEAQEYVVNRKSALDWLVERIGVSVDKDSGIVNDFNKFAEEKGEPRYCLDLILRVITVSLETLRIVRSLPHIDFAQCK
ncbi:MAG: type ISP restriction/modification enzyme, partial [Succinivibrionaceae bacterium]|nr:type ISP restriction/modification enzyme [Succinivibrionaceae bacterium]